MNLRYTCTMKSIRLATRGYSIMEILVVIIIISFAAAYAIPSFNKSVEKRRREQGLQNMRTIAAAARIMAERTRSFSSLCFDGLGNLAAINAACNTSVIDTTITYCGDATNADQLHLRGADSASGDFFVCTYDGYDGTNPVNFTLSLGDCAVTATDPCT